MSYFLRKKKKHKEKKKLEEVISKTTSGNLDEEIAEKKVWRASKTKAELAFERSKRKKVWK